MPKFIDKFRFVFQQNPFPFILYPAFLKKAIDRWIKTSNINNIGYEKGINMAQ